MKKSNLTMIFMLVFILSLAGCDLSVGGIVPLTHSPVDLDSIAFITPLGNFNPPGHTLPSNHIYFYRAKAQSYTVYAPVGGSIYEVYYNSGSNDYRVGIKASADFKVYLDHILYVSLKIGDTVHAGDVIGQTQADLYASDLGVVYQGITQPFADPNRYIEYSLHGDSPLKYFTEPLRSDLYAKVNRVNGSKDGQFCYDTVGTLEGNWFLQGLPEKDSTNVSNGDKQLCFAYDVSDGSVIRICIGGTVASAGLYYVQAGAPTPESVTVSSGQVNYQLFVDNHSPQSGLLMVQLLSDTSVKVEYVAGSATSGNFSSNACTYVR
jgi:hypothetical protein